MPWHEPFEKLGKDEQALEAKVADLTKATAAITNDIGKKHQQNLDAFNQMMQNQANLLQHIMLLKNHINDLVDNLLLTRHALRPARLLLLMLLGFSAGSVLIAAAAFAGRLVTWVF